jgi:hypothetical protein
MLIPNAKFLVLPLVALAVIASLPSAGPRESAVETRATVVRAKPVTACEPTRVASHCAVAMQLSATVVR